MRKICHGTIPQRRYCIVRMAVTMSECQRGMGCNSERCLGWWQETAQIRKTAQVDAAL